MTYLFQNKNELLWRGKVSGGRFVGMALRAEQPSAGEEERKEPKKEKDQRPPEAKEAAANQLKNKLQDTVTGAETKKVESFVNDELDKLKGVLDGANVGNLIETKGSPPKKKLVDFASNDSVKSLIEASKAAVSDNQVDGKPDAADAAEKKFIASVLPKYLMRSLSEAIGMKSVTTDKVEIEKELKSLQITSASIVNGQWKFVRESGANAANPQPQEKYLTPTREAEVQQENEAKAKEAEQKHIAERAKALEKVDLKSVTSQKVDFTFGGDNLKLEQKYDDVFSQLSKSLQPRNIFSADDLQKTFSDNYNQNKESFKKIYGVKEDYKLPDNFSEIILALNKNGFRSIKIESGKLVMIDDKGKSHSDFFSGSTLKDAPDAHDIYLDPLLKQKADAEKKLIVDLSKEKVNPPEVQRVIDELKKMGEKVETRYLDLFQKILDYEKGGSPVKSKISLNGTEMPLIFGYNAEKNDYVLNVDKAYGGHIYSNSKEGILSTINSGEFLRLFQENGLKAKSNYPDLKLLDEPKETTKGYVFLALDWQLPGIDPKVWVRAENHGRVSVVIQGKEIGVDGQDTYRFVAEDMQDLQNKLNRFVIFNRKMKEKNYEIDWQPGGAGHRVEVPSRRLLDGKVQRERREMLRKEEWLYEQLDSTDKLNSIIKKSPELSQLGKVDFVRQKFDRSENEHGAIMVKFDWMNRLHPGSYFEIKIPEGSAKMNLIMQPGDNPVGSGLELVKDVLLAMKDAKSLDVSVAAEGRKREFLNGKLSENGHENWELAPGVEISALFGTHLEMKFAKDAVPKDFDALVNGKTNWSEVLKQLKELGYLREKKASEDRKEEEAEPVVKYDFTDISKVVYEGTTTRVFPSTKEYTQQKFDTLFSSEKDFKDVLETLKKPVLNDLKKYLYACHSNLEGTSTEQNATYRQLELTVTKRAIEMNYPDAKQTLTPNIAKKILDQVKMQLLTPQEYMEHCTQVEARDKYRAEKAVREKAAKETADAELNGKSVKDYLENHPFDQNENSLALQASQLLFEISQKDGKKQITDFYSATFANVEYQNLRDQLIINLKVGQGKSGGAPFEYMCLKIFKDSANKTKVSIAEGQNLSYETFSRAEKFNLDDITKTAQSKRSSVVKELMANLK